MRKQKGVLELSVATVFGLVALAASAVGVILGSVAVSRRTPPPSKAEADCISFNVTPVNNTVFSDYQTTYEFRGEVCNESSGPTQISAFIQSGYDNTYVMNHSGGLGVQTLEAGQCVATLPNTNFGVNMQSAWTQPETQGTTTSVTVYATSRNIGDWGCSANEIKAIIFGTAEPTPIITPSCTPYTCSPNSWTAEEFQQLSDDCWNKSTPECLEYDHDCDGVITVADLQYISGNCVATPSEPTLNSHTPPAWSEDGYLSSAIFRKDDGFNTPLSGNLSHHSACLELLISSEDRSKQCRTNLGCVAANTTPNRTVSSHCPQNGTCSSFTDGNGPNSRYFLALRYGTASGSKACYFGPNFRDCEGIPSNWNGGFQFANAVILTPTPTPTSTLAPSPTPTATLTPGPGAPPDLIVEDIWGLGGDVHYQVKNQGGSKSQKCKSSLQIRGMEPQALGEIPSLSPGSSVQEKLWACKFGCPRQGDSVRVCVDVHGHVAESDEGNNCLEKRLYYDSCPQLGEGWVCWTVGIGCPGTMQTAPDGTCRDADGNSSNACCNPTEAQPSTISGTVTLNNPGQRAVGLRVCIEDSQQNRRQENCDARYDFINEREGEYPFELSQWEDGSFLENGQVVLAGARALVGEVPNATWITDPEETYPSEKLRVNGLRVTVPTNDLHFTITIPGDGAGGGVPFFETDLDNNGVTNSLDWDVLVTDWVDGNYTALDASLFLWNWAIH